MGDEIGGRFRGPSGEVEGQSPCQQLVQHDTKRVDIRVHPDPAAPELVLTVRGAGYKAAH